MLNSFFTKLTSSICITADMAPSVLKALIFFSAVNCSSLRWCPVPNITTPKKQRQDSKATKMEDGNRSDGNADQTLNVVAHGLKALQQWAKHDIPWKHLPQKFQRDVFDSLIEVHKHVDCLDTYT